MFVTQPLNELAKLALIASDASYFTATLSAPQILAPLQDTPSYNILPTYTIAQGFEKQFERRNDAIGFKFVTYKNTTTNEVIVAFGGTDGPDPVDWTGSTALGWNQWVSGREQMFADLQLMVDSETKIHFTGQSLGGALAQYAAYEWVQTKLTVTDTNDPEFLADFDKSNVSLTTFNSLGGLKGLVDNLPTSGVQHAAYDSTVLQGLGLSGHFYVTNDLVSRLGGGHVGGETFLLDFKSGNVNSETQQAYAYGLVDAHRIETGLYANLRPGALLEFQVAGARAVDYLNVDSVQAVAALFGNLLNNKNLGWTLSLNVENLVLTGTADISGTGSSANNVLVGNSGHNTLTGGAGEDTVEGGGGDDSLLGGSSHDLLNGGDGTDTLDGGSGDDHLLGGVGNDSLTGGSGTDQLTGGTGNDTLAGGSGNDLYTFARGDGQDTIIDSDPFPANQDRALFDATINPLDLVISRQANDLRLAIHGSTDSVTVQDWYVGTRDQIETIQAGNGQTLLSTQVDQLIQAMAGVTQQTGLTWDQAIDQQPAQVQSILAASWQ